MIKVVILAAGKGTRMKSELPKVLVPLAGRPMIKYLLDSVIASGVDRQPIVVVSPDNQKIISDALREYNCFYAVQEKQLGSGHALAAALAQIAPAEKIISLNGDHPFLSSSTIQKIADEHKGAITMMTVELSDFFDWRQVFKHWGRIVRNDGKIRSIKEYKDADEKIRAITEVNPAVYSFSAAWLVDNIKKLNNDNVQKEYYLTDLVKILSEQNEDIHSIAIRPEEAIGINSQEELTIAENLLNF